MGFAYASLPPITSGSQDGQGDFSTPGPTWHYRHVALCLNERKNLAYLGVDLHLSDLPTEIRDDAITYAEINLARTMIKAMCVSSIETRPTCRCSRAYNYFVKNSNIITASAFASISDLLTYCGLAQSSWMNVLYGVVSYQENMQAGSTLVLKCIRELQLAVSKMIYRTSTVYPVTASHSNAASNAGIGIGSWTNAWNTVPTTAGTMIGNYNILVQGWISNNPDPNKYFCIRTAPANSSETVSFTSPGAISRKLNIVMYIPDRYVVDVMGLGYTAASDTRWIRLYESPLYATATTSCVVPIKSFSDMVITPAPTSTDIYHEITRIGYGVDDSFFYGNEQMTFINDAQLYKNSY